jgi:hypothetical protein
VFLALSGDNLKVKMNVSFVPQGLREEGESVGKTVLESFSDAEFTKFSCLVAFVSVSGVEGLSEAINDSKQHITQFNVIFGIDQKATSKESLESLLSLDINAKIYYSRSAPIFHPKIYVFDGEQRCRIIVGSSNFTQAGLSELVFITRPIDKARVERAFMTIKKEGENYVTVGLKSGELSMDVPYSKLKPALRTLTAIKTFNPESTDYILIQKPEQFDAVLNLSKWGGKFNWIEHQNNVAKKESFVVVGRRFRPNSNNTHHFAFCSSKKLVAPDTFKILEFTNYKEALIQTLILNSSITIANILSYREQTTGGFTDIRESELVSFDIFKFKNLGSKQIAKLEASFNRLKKIEFKSIKSQYIENARERRELDSTILEILGFNPEEIKNQLDKLYRVISEELQTKD